MEFDDFDFKKIDKEAQQKCLDKYVGKWLKCSIKDIDGEWNMYIARIVGVADVQEGLRYKTSLVCREMNGVMDLIPVEEIEEQMDFGERYFTVMDEEMAKSELAIL